MTLTTVFDSKPRSFRVRRGGVIGLAEHRSSVPRKPDGLIDFDSYRKQVAALRRQAKRQYAMLMCVYGAFLLLCMGVAIVNAPATSDLGATAINLSFMP